MSAKSFIEYLKTKDTVKILCIAVIGVLLIVLGASRTDKNEETASDFAKEVSELCSSVDGVGDCKVMLYYKETNEKYNTGEGQVESVVVVCDGADNIEVKNRLVGMLSSFFGIGSNRIRIVKAVA